MGQIYVRVDIVCVDLPFTVPKYSHKMGATRIRCFCRQDVGHTCASRDAW